jgi:hypothetical protein
MKTLALFTLILSVSAGAQDVGNFEIYQNNFKDLYNKYRVAQPRVTPWAGSFFPYSQQGTAVKLNAAGDAVETGASPMETYGALAGVGKQAHEWEKESHSCDQYEGQTKESCEGWWGHCNGWAAAAVKEAEPRASVKVGGRTLSVAEQKGILTELWLSSGSLNAGWTDKSKKNGDWVNDHTRRGESYRKFWDVSPRAFFLIFTNTIGAEKTGVVIDRFTGDEVWNQPVVGYRLLPIRAEDIAPVRDGNRSYWSVKVRTKLYWANDLGTPPGHISKPFDINKISDNEEVDYVGHDYEGRYLAFRLNFDAPVKMSADGKQVVSAGRMVGDGMWEHQENSRNFDVDELNQTHPDFIWLPTDPIQDYNGYGNPFLDANIVSRITRQQATAPVAQPTVLRFAFSARAFSNLAPAEIKKAVGKVIRREGLRHAIYVRDIQVAGGQVVVGVRFADKVDAQALVALFGAANMLATVTR